MIGCPNECVYCPQDSLKVAYLNNSKKKMNLQDFDFFLDQLDIPMDIHFSGYSEPAVVSDAVDMIQLAFDRGFSVGISTTLRGLKAKDIQLFAKYNFKSFTVHMPDADGLMKYPIDEKFLQLLKESTKIGGVKYMVMGRIDERAAKIINKKLPSAKNLTDRGGNLDLTEIPLSIKDDFHHPINISGALYCTKRPMVDQFVLLPNGIITLCNSDYGMKHVLGNLMENKMSEIIDGKPFQRVREAMMGKNDDYLLCRTCRNAAPITMKYRLHLLRSEIRSALGLERRKSKR